MNNIVHFVRIIAHTNTTRTKNTIVMKTNKYILTLLLTVWCAVGNIYAVEKSYYNSIDGKSGATLREALTTLTYTKHTTDVGYNWTFDGIDIVNGEVLDIYSTCTWTAAQQGKNYSGVCDSYNREHLVPQSVFEEKTPQRSDRHHLFLADGKVNQIRSSYPFGETDATNGFSGLSNESKALGQFGIASSGYTGNVYEPDDEYKGDVARAVLYMVIRYATSDVCKTYGGSANSYPVTTWSNAMFSSSLSTNYGLSDKAKAVFLAWHRADPVSAKEVARNNGVEAKQGNRNPFIDLPDLVEYLWGDHAGETVNLSGLTIATGGGSVPTPYELTLNRHGVTQTLTCTGIYTLPTASTEEDACDGWEFKGWTTSNNYSSTTAPNYTTTVSAAATLYAVYGNTTSSAPIRKTPAAANTVMWAETWTGATTATSGSNSATPSANYGKGTTVYNSGTVTYTQSENTVYVRNEELAGGSKPELMLSSGKTWTISNIPTGEATELTLTYKSNNTKSSVTCSTTGASITGSSKSYTITTGGASTITLVFGCSGNTRIDDVSLTVKTAGTGGGSTTTTYKTSPDCGSLRTITLSNSGVATGGDFMANVSSAYPGATITLTADPDPGYEFDSWSVTKQGGGSVTVTSNQFTMPDANVTVSATFNALTRHNIRFFNNGSQIGSTQSVYVGGTPNIPADPEGCDGYTFVGWYTASLATNNTTSHTWVTDFTVSAAQDYYAVFAHTEGGGGSSTPVKATSITIGDEVILVYENGDTKKELSGFSSTSTVYGTVADYTTTPAGTYAFQVVAGSSTDTYALKHGSVYAYWSSGNSLSSSGTLNANSSWSISFNNGNAIIANANTSSRVIYYNTGSPRFACYTSAQGAVQLYKMGAGGTTYYTSTTSCASACTTLATPVVTATPGNGQITLTWPAVADADHYTVTISSGAGYTTECGTAASIEEVTGTTTKTCVISGLTNGLEYTTTVVANATSATCDSEADTDTATPQDCTPWADPTLSWNRYSLNTTTAKTATLTVTGTTHGTRSFESSNTEVLTVNNANGAVTAVGAGSATVTAHWTAASGYCEKTMTSSTFEVAGPLTISFDANADGVTGSMTDQTVTYKVSTAIKDNAFEREGYTFIGWATSADGEKVYNDKQSVAFTNSQTLYAKWQLNSRNVTFTPSPSGATVTVNGKSTSPQAVNYGETVTVHIAPANHYTITTVSIKGATSGNDIAQTGSGETRTFTMPDENVTVSITMTPESTYTATFYNSGVAYGVAQTGYADDDINAPATNPVSCDADEFTFVGWVAAEQTSETTSKPEVLTFPQTMPVGNVNYYALYRRVEGSGGGEASVTFKTASSDGNTAYTEDDEIKENLVESYTGISSFAGNKAYLGKSGVKLGASGSSGYITLNLSSPITTNTITVSAAKYGTDTGNLQVEVNGSTSFGDEQSPADGTLTFTNASDVEISDLTISTTSKRAYVASISLGGGGTSYYTTSPVCTPCDYHVTLTKGAETNGTFTLSKTNGTYDNCKTNFAVTVSNIVPATGYYCSGVSATGGSHVIVSEPDANGNYTVSFPKGNTVTSTVTAVFEEIPSHTVTWSANGNTSNTASYKEGATITFPESATGCDGMTFMGWSAVEVEEQDNAPDYTTSATMGTEDITFYAVFATETTSGSGSAETLVSTGSSGKSTVNALDGVTCSGLGSDYSSHSPYLLRFDDTGDYIQFDLAAAPATLSFGYKMVGGNSNSTMKVEECATANGTYSTVQSFTISGAQNSTGTFTTTATFTQSHVRMTFNKGSNVGVGNITITGSSSTTTYTGYTTSCTTPTEVTVTFNANGGTGTMADQNVPYNTATALTANSFSRTGYSFAGWATTADGTKVYDDEESVTLTKNLNLFALWTKNTYKVYFTPDMTGQATVTVNGASSSPQSVEFGGAVNIVINPDVAYTVSGVTATAGVTPSGSGNNWSFTMPASDVTITVTLTAKPTYTIRFYDSGALIGSAQTVISGQAATPPSTASLGCEGYTFVGWWTAELDEDNTETKTWVTNFTATQAQDYYAVYSHVDDGNGGNGQVTFTFSDVATSNSWQHDSNYPDVTISPISIHVDKGSSSYQGRWWNTDKTWRLYAGNTLTVSCSTGDVTAVTSTPSKTFTISEGVATYSGAVNLSSIVVSYGGGTTYYTTITDCGACTTPTLEFAASEVTKYDGDDPFVNPLTVSGNNLNATLTFTSSNENKATVSSTGQVTIKDAMSNTPVTITATLAKTIDGDNCQKKVTASYTLNIYNKVTWSVNGIAHTEGNPTTYTTEGNTITAYPTNPDGSTVCGGKTFMGWTTAEVDETDTKPTTLYTSLSSMSNVHITQSTTFYAVFAEAGGVSDEVYGKGTSDNLTNGQRVLIVHSNTGRALSNAESGTGYEGKLMTITNGQITTTDETIIWTVETGSTGYKFKIGDKYVNAGESQGGKHYLYYDESPDEWTLTGSAPYVLSSSEDPGYQMEYYNSIFTTYTGTSGTAYEMDFYVPAAGYTAYTTTCGPNIKAAAVERLTSTKNQTVKSQALTVKGGSLDGNTLTATITGTDAAQFTCALEANTITSGGINTTYTISYTPTVFGVTHEATLTFTDGTTSSDPITLRGRSLPEQFAIVAYDGSKYYVLDGTMTGEAKPVRPIEVTVSGGEVTMCPERAVYYMTQLATPNQNVHLVGQAGRLYGAGSSTGLNTKSLTSTSGTDWLLTTSDFDNYHVTNATSSTRGVMYNETNNAFGHYATSNYGTVHYFGDIRLLPIGTICTCLNAPVATVTPRSTSATITWSAVANAIRYDVTCSGGSVSVSGTTATITGLTGNTTYTYSVKAVASGADCSLSYNDSFTTSSCDDVPQDVRVTPNVKEAIIRWTAEAEQAKVILYSDAECTTPVKTIDPAVSPCTVEDLAEDARYYVKVFGGADKNCESAVVSFSTLTTAVEIVEWLTDGVKILLTGDDQTASIYIEDKQENAGGTTTKVAEDIFFSKYFEASGFTKLVGLYNGTDHAIDISDLIIKGGQNGWTETKGANNYIAVGDISKLKNDYGEGDKIMLPKNTEIILYTVRDENKSDYTGEGCVDGFYDWDKLAANTEDNWYRIGKTNSSGSMVDDDGHNQLNFSGPYSIGLFRGSELIDIIGAGTASRPYDTYTVIKDKSKDSELFPFTLGNGRVIEKANDKEGFFCKDGMSPPSEEYPEGYTTYLSTNLCFLMRKNEVVSGANAVDKNKADFVTLCDEWLGVPIGNDLSSAEKSCLSGGQFGYVGSYDYQGYYAQFDSITTITELENHKNDDGTITIPVDRLDTLSCSKLRITVYEGGVEKASKEYQVPIMIASGTKVTTDELFTKHNAETCASCDVVVFNGATLQKGEAASGRNAIHDLTLYPGSTLDLPSGKGDYSVNSVTYRVEGDNVPITSLNGNLMIESETQQLIVTRRITNDRYYFMSLPYDCNVADIRLSNGTPATNGVDFRLLEYDGEARALEGSLVGAPGHWKLVTDDVLEAGKGYAIAVSSKKPKEIVFPMTLPSGNLTSEERAKYNTVDLNEYTDPSGDVRKTNYNWNLIAHPYITKFEVTGATSVEAYWESPSRQDSAWVDDWKTWPEEDPTQPTDTTHTQNPDSTETHIGDILESGTVDNGLVWVLYANATMELTGGGQMVDFSSLEAVPWAQHRQFIKDLKIGGDVQKIGKYAFSQCTNLVTVTIAAPVTNLASYAFAGCTQLRSFRIESTQYISATTTTFDGVSTLSVYVPQSMYDQYRQNSPWNKMALSAFDGSSTTGGDGSNTNPTPRRVAEHPDGWTESAGGIYVTVPIVVDGKVDYEQHWINDVDDIKPFTAVFIQGDGKGQMTFNMYPATPAPKRMLQADRYETRDHTVFVGLTINGNGHKDMTSLRLRPDFPEEYKFNLDLLKFTTFYTSRPQIYFKTEKDQLAFRAVSDSLAANTWLPVGVYCRDAGEYTFALHDRYVWDEVEAVYLRDNVTGAETNLLMGNYTITTTGQIYTNTRFAVKVLLRRKVKDTPTMIDHTEDPNAPRKFFRDGLLYIMRDGKVYDLTGKPVQFDDLLNR